MFVLDKSGEIIRNKENVAQVFNKFVVNKMKNILVNKIGTSVYITIQTLLLMVIFRFWTLPSAICDSKKIVQFKYQS